MAEYIDTKNPTTFLWTKIILKYNEEKNSKLK